jgi:hypothetical protein
MGTHYIDYEPRSASAKRRGVLRIAALACSMALASGYVIYRTRAAPSPAARIRVLSRVSPLTARSFSIVSSQPAAATATTSPAAPTTQELRQMLLMSSSKSGAIVPPPPSTQP